jgi:hypothetical protein
MLSKHSSLFLSDFISAQSIGSEDALKEIEKVAVKKYL